MIGGGVSSAEKRKKPQETRGGSGVLKKLLRRDDAGALKSVRVEPLEELWRRRLRAVKEVSGRKNNRG